jgi:hypothetical protein
MSDDIAYIIMCGSRTWNNGSMVCQEIVRLYHRYGGYLTIIHGDEPNGADECIRHWCEELEINHIIYCATKPKHTPHRLCKIVQVSDWNVDGKSAGPKRNRAMRNDYYYIAKGCVAFRATGKSDGTDGMIRLAADAGIPRIVYLDDGRRITS